MAKNSGAFRTGIVTFVIAVVLSGVFELTGLSFLPATVILVVIIGVGIIFDIVGTAVTASNEEALHAMAADRVPGSRWAILLVRRADRVANFCNDVVGDICGTTSGAAGAAIVLYLAGRDVNPEILRTVIVGVVAALTVGGKAAGKHFALRQSERIMVLTGRIIAAADSTLGLQLFERLNRSARRNRKKRPVPAKSMEPVRQKSSKQVRKSP